MLHLSKRKKGNSYSTIFLLLLTSTLVTLGACSKQIDLTDQDITEFGYEVDCEYCEISYTDESNAVKTISHNQGKWSYKLSDKVIFELKLSIKTTLSGNQAIQAFVLKNGEVVFGDVGYNYAKIIYNTKNATGIGSYGSYQNTGAGSDPGNGGNTGGGTKPVSSVCGAKNKTGGYCKRVVSGGGRCWQHK